MWDPVGLRALPVYRAVLLRSWLYYWFCAVKEGSWGKPCGLSNMMDWCGQQQGMQNYVDIPWQYPHHTDVVSFQSNVVLANEDRGIQIGTKLCIILTDMLCYKCNEWTCVWQNPSQWEARRPVQRQSAAKGLHHPQHRGGCRNSHLCRYAASFQTRTGNIH